MNADLFIDMHGQTVGDPVTTTVLDDGARSSGPYGTWTPGQVPNVGFTVAAHQVDANQVSVGRPFDVLVGGTVYPAGSADLAIAFDTSTGKNADEINNLPVGHRVVSWQGYFFTGPPSSGDINVLYDLITLSTEKSHYVVLQLVTGGSVTDRMDGIVGYRIRLETNPAISGTTHSDNINLTPSTWYRATIQNDQNVGLGTMIIYDMTDTQVGPTMIAPTDPGDDVTDFRFGNNENGNATSTIWFQSQMLNWSTGALYLKAAAVSLAGLTQTYDGTPKPVTATTLPVVLPAGQTIDVTYNGSATAPIDAGTYAVVATIKDDPINPTYTYTGIATGTLVISQAAASVTLGDLSATYDGSAKSATATTNPASLAVTFAYNGLATAPTNAGSYPVVGTINDPNYTGTASGTLVIAQAAASVTLGDLSAIYDGSPKVATATTNPANLAVDFTYDGSATAPTDAGSYAVVGTINDINFTGTASGALAVVKAPLTVTANNQTRVYGTANPVFTATLSGFVNGETAAVVGGTPAFGGPATTAIATGTYAITPAAGSLLAANYSFGTFVSGTLTVTKAILTVTADDKTRVFHAVNPALTVSYNGFVNGDNASSLTAQPTATTTAILASAVGVYPITPSGGVSSNYTFSYVVGNLAVLHSTVNDFKGNGNSDLLWANTVNGDHYLWLMNGGSVSASIFLGTVGTQWTAITGDFNADGESDILWSNTVNGDRYLWLMNGGSVTASIFLGTIPTQWTAIAGDFNGDGDSDLLWSNSVNGDRYLWLMNGGSVSASVFLGTIPTQWTAIAGDFNGDGDSDLLWSNSINGDRYLWLMNGGSVTANVFLGTIPTKWTAITGDLNGDGDADLLWSNSVNGDRYLWLMNGGSVSASVFLGTIPSQWTAATGEFDGDGKADIIWSNSVNGDRYLWLMNGGSVTASIFLGTVAPVWHISP